MRVHTTFGNHVYQMAILNAFVVRLSFRFVLFWFSFSEFQGITRSTEYEEEEEKPLHSKIKFSNLAASVCLHLVYQQDDHFFYLFHVEWEWK